MFEIWRSYIGNRKRICYLFSFAIIFFMTVFRVQEVRAQSEDKGYFVLGLIAYNYTDRLIEEYTVDGSGGGDVRLSSPTSGGSGVMCCARLSKDRKERILVTVRWQFDGCSYKTEIPGGKIWERRKFHYKEAKVYLKPSLSKESAYLETHFYADGSVKVKVTDEISLPELKLDEDRADFSKFPKCENNDLE